MRRCGGPARRARGQHRWRRNRPAILITAPLACSQVSAVRELWEGVRVLESRQGVPTSPSGLDVDSRGLTAPRGSLRPRLQVALDGRPVLAADHFLRGRRLPWPAGLRPVLPGLGATHVSLVDDQGRVLAEATTTSGAPIPVLTSVTGLHWALADGQQMGLARCAARGVLRAEIEQLLDADSALAARRRGIGLPGLGGWRHPSRRGTQWPRHPARRRRRPRLPVAPQLPSDVARESFALERSLVNRGWRTRRYSAAHLQLTPADDVHSPVHVDLFSAFFHDGEIHQPFHIRGPFAEDQLLPLEQRHLAWIASCPPQQTSRPGWS